MDIIQSSGGSYGSATCEWSGYTIWTTEIKIDNWVSVLLSPEQSSQSGTFVEQTLVLLKPQSVVRKKIDDDILYPFCSNRVNKCLLIRFCMMYMRSMH